MSTLSHIAITDIGKARANNEDYYLIDENLNLFILADGIGGHNYGEIAAEKACVVAQEKIAQILKISPPQDLETAYAMIKFAIYSANKAIFQMALDEPKYKGMGTTLAICYRFLNQLIVAHVGDSRVYVCQDYLQQLTQDHTIFASKSPKSPSFRGKHYLTKSLGIKEYIDPTITVFPFHENSTYLLCSDGLSDYLVHTEIEAIMKDSFYNVPKKAAKLIEAALKTEAKDNITFILIQPEKT